MTDEQRSSRREGAARWALICGALYSVAGLAWRLVGQLTRDSTVQIGGKLGMCLTIPRHALLPALLMLCTHKGCEVKPAGVILLCPCHDSEFAQDGTVLKGPANVPLSAFRTSHDENHVFIHLP